MEVIGGYFGLELRGGEHYHKNALRLNTTRNCFEYILRVKHYIKVYIPYYTCEVMLEPLKKCNVEYEFYHINEKLEPVTTCQLKQDEAFLYTNYFGLKQECVERLSNLYGKQLIVDNAQAFYAKPLKGVDTFYSARKFFGVSDGAYLYTDTKLDIDLERDYSYNRMSHLLKRIDLSAEEGYKDFQKNDDDLIDNPIRLMSSLTDKILCSVDYEIVKQQRQNNYLFLHLHLKTKNGMELKEINEDEVPMVYPFYCEKENLRKQLIEKKIYVATYWNNVFDWCNENTIDYKMAKYLLPLPIDQRYNEEELHMIVNLIN